METMKKFFDFCGVDTDEMFVEETGVKLLKTTEITEDARILFNIMHLSSKTEFERSAEFNSKMTYFSFTDKLNGDRLNDDMMNKYFHLSVCGDFSITFLIVGITDEILKELTAHREAHVSRLTSSKTKAQNATYYRVWGTDAQKLIQKRFIKKFLELKSSDDMEELTLEQKNSLNLPNKCAACEYTMTIKDFHKFLIGRSCESGNEAIIQEVAQKIAKLLNEKYPLLIKTPDEYKVMNNGEKLKV